MWTLFEFINENFFRGIRVLVILLLLVGENKWYSPLPHKWVRQAPMRSLQILACAPWLGFPTYAWKGLELPQLKGEETD